jgi:hypothetical protein
LIPRGNTYRDNLTGVLNLFGQDVPLCRLRSLRLFLSEATEEIIRSKNRDSIPLMDRQESF